MASQRVPSINPPPGTNAIADKIRERRQPDHKLLELDQVLLNAEPIADGWDKLFGAIRSRSTLPGDVRELMILRVGALNGAAYEWIQHEAVGRSEGLSSEDLNLIRNISDDSHTPGWSKPALYLAAIRFTDASTRSIRISTAVFDYLKHQLSKCSETSSNVDQMMVEALAVVSGYNMVSRFLVGLNVANMADDEIPES